MVDSFFDEADDGWDQIDDGWAADATPAYSPIQPVNPEDQPGYLSRAMSAVGSTISGLGEAALGAKDALLNPLDFGSMVASNVYNNPGETLVRPTVNALGQLPAAGAMAAGTFVGQPVAGYAAGQVLSPLGDTVSQTVNQLFGLEAGRGEQGGVDVGANFSSALDQVPGNLLMDAALFGAGKAGVATRNYATGASAIDRSAQAAIGNPGYVASQLNIPTDTVGKGITSNIIEGTPEINRTGILYKRGAFDPQRGVFDGEVDIQGFTPKELAKRAEDARMQTMSYKSQVIDEADAFVKPLPTEKILFDVDGLANSKLEASYRENTNASQSLASEAAIISEWGERNAFNSLANGKAQYSLRDIEDEIVKSNRAIRDANEYINKNVLAPDPVVTAQNQATINAHKDILNVLYKARENMFEGAPTDALGRIKQANQTYGALSDLQTGAEYSIGQEIAQQAGPTKAAITDNATTTSLAINSNRGIGARVGEGAANKFNEAVRSLDKPTSGFESVVAQQKKAQSRAAAGSAMQANQYKKQSAQIRSDVAASMFAIPRFDFETNIGLDQIEAQPMLFMATLAENLQNIPASSPEEQEMVATSMMQDAEKVLRTGTQKDKRMFVSQLQEMGVIPMNPIAYEVDGYIDLPEGRQKFIDNKRVDLAQGKIDPLEYGLVLLSMTDKNNGKIPKDRTMKPMRQ
jgi:hypothetical protein